MLIHLHHRDLFIHRLLGLHGVARPISVSWRYTPLSTMYPPIKFESSAGDSSFESSVGPSRKRCRSLAATVTSSIHSTRALVPSRVDLLPPRKRFRDSFSLEDSVEENIDTDIDRGTMKVGVDMDDGIDIPNEISLQRIEDIETTQRQLDAG
nr:hypothetical protein [Tanacetum cinerariifolium]